MDYSVRNPENITILGLASFPFARRYLENRFFFLFLRLLRCFSSAGLPTYRCTMSSTQWVAPFGYLRINSCVPIPVAFRSLSRPSSPLRAQASPIRSCITSFCSLIIKYNVQINWDTLSNVLVIYFRFYFYNMSKNMRLT